MVGAFGDVMDAETEGGGESAKARGRGLSRDAGFRLREVELIDGLIFVAALSVDLNIFVAGDESIDKKYCSAGLMVILENQVVVDAACRKCGAEFEMNLADALLNFFERRKVGRVQTSREVLPIDGEEDIVENTLGVCDSLLIGEGSVGIGVDVGDD